MVEVKTTPEALGAALRLTQLVANYERPAREPARQSLGFWGDVRRSAREKIGNWVGDATLMLAERVWGEDHLNQVEFALGLIEEDKNSDKVS